MDPAGQVALDPTVPDTFPAGSRRPGAAPPAPSLDELGAVTTAAGSTIDRFVVLERLGAGGMGVVLAAHDPELDRRVALKLLRPAPDGRGPTAEQRARAVREAQAMARLSHPNVITVHDVGTIGGSVFIAMELVDGGTLREWLAARPPGPGRWRPVLDVMIAAGRGLAAAHAAGLVHRDFKPDNVLVGRDGRVRVTDFGLVSPLAASDDGRPAAAVTPGDATPREPASSSSVSSGARAATALTRAGAIMGTPRYMAPEQHAGRAVDARADQYAFCKVLLEGLGGAVDADLVDTVRARGPRPRSSTRAVRPPHVPRWLFAAIARGLATDPAARHRSMDALLAELTRERGRRARGLAAGCALAAAAVTIGLVALRAERAADPCGDDARALRGAWDPAVAARVHAALTAGGAPYGEATWRETRRLLDGYGGELTAMRAEACRATRVRGEQPEAVLALRRQCLTRREEALAAATERLASPGAAARAADVVAGLPAIADCADPLRLSARAPLPAGEAARARVGQVQHQLDTLRARRLAGELHDLERDARAVVALARTVEYPPVVAEALLELGEVQLEASAADGPTTLREALAAATRAHDVTLEADAWTRLLHAEVALRGQPAEAEAWLPLASAAVDGLADPGRRAQLRAVQAMIALRLGRHDEARREATAALDERVALLGDQHPQVAALHELVALALRAGGERDGAIAHHQAALALRLRLGDEHPRVADSRTNLGLALRDAGRYAEALAEQDRALAIRRRVYGDEHLEVAAARNNRAMALQDLGRADEAAAEYQAALELHERHLAPDHPRVIAGHNNLGLALHDLGRDREAAPHLRLALAARERTLPAGHVDTSITRGNLGRALVGLGDEDAGLAALVAAAAQLERALGPAHPTVAYWQGELGSAAADLGRGEQAAAACRRSLAAAVASAGEDSVDAAYGRVCLGQAELVLGRPAAAARLLAPALDVLVASEEMPFDVAVARLLLARALRAAGREPARVRALALAARAGFEASAGAAARLAEVDAFLAARPTTRQRFDVSL